jgi:hypothetical protein
MAATRRLKKVEEHSAKFLRDECLCHHRVFGRLLLLPSFHSFTPFSRPRSLSLLSQELKELTDKTEGGEIEWMTVDCDEDSDITKWNATIEGQV